MDLVVDVLGNADDLRAHDEAFLTHLNIKCIDDSFDTLASTLDFRPSLKARGSRLYIYGTRRLSFKSRVLAPRLILFHADLVMNINLNFAKFSSRPGIATNALYHRAYQHIAHRLMARFFTDPPRDLLLFFFAEQPFFVLLRNSYQGTM